MTPLHAWWCRALREFAERVLSGVSSSIAMQPRAEIIAAALRDHGAVFWCGSGEQTIAFANEYAPEHLLIATREPQELAALVRNAGTIFLGETSSVSFGDYMTGANHVLPTGGLARSYSGLSALDFVCWTTWQSISRAAARSLADDVATFAEAESLDAHAAAARAWGEG
jgi:histidinol dehydrogenase